jgi:hypothetical protein
MHSPGNTKVKGRTLVFLAALLPGLMTRFFSDCLEPARQTHCLKFKVVGCAVLDRLGGFVFAVYLLLIGCAAFAIVSAFTFAVRLPGHSLRGTVPAKVSRAEAGLRLRERTANWRPPQAASLVPPAPQMSVSELTKGLEAAEGTSPPMRKTHLVRRPRVAGWVQREKPGPRSRVSNESTNRVILRSLFAQN